MNAIGCEREASEANAELRDQGDGDQYPGFDVSDVTQAERIIIERGGCLSYPE